MARPSVDQGFAPGGVDAFAPGARTLPSLAEAAVGCRACPLWANATWTVFGEGPATARIVLVGEQPGDQEDRAGRPFVGPAGAVLDRALAAAGIDRGSIWLTNAVKHFKNVPRGKKRMHDKPNLREIDTCARWLDLELAALSPATVICLGASAARGVFGKTIRIGSSRGAPLPGGAAHAAGAAVWVTWHPSAALRADDADRRRIFEELTEDLRRAVTSR